MIRRAAHPAPKPNTSSIQRTTAKTSRTFSLEASSKAANAGPARAQETASASPAAKVLVSLEKQRRAIDRLIDQAGRGRDFSPTQLLRLQATVYRYGQDMEVLSRVVDRTVGALKTTLNTQL